MRRSRSRTRSRKKPTFTHKISQHFSKRDFSCQCGDCANAIKVSLGLVGGLELLREKVKKRVNVIKGFMCQTATEKSGSYKRNFHLMGLAADITVSGLEAKDVFQIAEDIPEFKGIGLNLKENFVHVDTRKIDDVQKWVVVNGERIELTPENRNTYFGESD
ncbi:MAG: hypothetical protein ACI9BD_001503 [Candidatus Marinamargulisbacteria bacterium]|jgi:hypothetical protein